MKREIENIKLLKAHEGLLNDNFTEKALSDEKVYKEVLLENVNTEFNFAEYYVEQNRFEEKVEKVLTPDTKTEETSINLDGEKSVYNAKIEF